MSRLQQKCPRCGKLAKAVRRVPYIGSGIQKFMTDLECGHTLFEEGSAHNENELVSIDGRKPYPFQLQGIEFLEDANFRALVADEMGLGKTIQAIVPIKSHNLTPAIFACKSGLRMQVMTEIVRWLGKEFAPYIVHNSKDGLLPGFPVYIISYDVLWRPKVLERIQSIKAQYIILDECQHLKNSGAKRTAAVRELIRDIPHVVALSGTPIKNRASEYFTILNILNPTLFPSYNHYLYNHVNFYHDGYSQKERGLKNPEKFHELTKHFIIRRERKEVLPELPTIDRKFFYVDLDDSIRKKYMEEQSEFSKAYQDALLEGKENSFETYTNLLARLSKLRHMVGISKIQDALEFITDFIATTDRKIALFLHHQDVGVLLSSGIKEWCIANELDPPLVLTSDLNAEQRHIIVEKFKEAGRHRILIASTLASGEGLNLQYQCSDAIIMERQWNPANEEQVEARFTRPDAISKDYVSVTYMIAGNTIDEWFTSLVEEKRSVMHQVLDGRDEPWQETELVQKLFAKVAAEGRKTWSINDGPRLVKKE